MLDGNLEIEQAEKSQIRHLPALDGVRALAALMVMYFHFFQLHQGGSGSFSLFLQRISGAGQTGVTLFFVLSGFLISRLLIQNKTQPKYFLNFYARRSLRIFPLYYLFLIIYYFVLPFFKIQNSVGFSLQWPFWCYLQNFAITFKIPSEGPLHFWSLAVEEQFYLLWPFAVYFLNEVNLKKLIYVIIVVTVLLRVLLTYLQYEVFYFTFTNIDSLALGALLALQERSNTLLSIMKYLKYLALCIFIALVLWFKFSGTAMDAIQWFKALLVGIIYYCLLAICLKLPIKSPAKNILENGFLSFTGKISYGLYVYHPLSFLLVHLYLNLDSIIASFFVSFGVAYLFATTSFYLFEKPFLRLKNHFS